MKKIRCGVIGVGYLGRFHAQKYAMIPEAELVAVCDSDPKTCDVVSTELQVPGYVDYPSLLDKVDAVSIAATTNKHFEIAKTCLEKGIHVLLEKPMTETVEQANLLIALSKKSKVKFQIGHMERFNAARLAVGKYLHKPLFIESMRLAPYTPRGADVNVILDLMIHDIDIIQTMVDSPIKTIDASGAPILSSSIDIANARITFANHAVANVTASRISFKTERKTRIFQSDSYISIDFQDKRFAVFEKGVGEMFPGIPDIVRHQSAFEKGDALLEEIKAFLLCIAEDSEPLVTAEEGRNALATAEDITRRINANLSLQDVI